MYVVALESRNVRSPLPKKPIQRLQDSWGQPELMKAFACSFVATSLRFVELFRTFDKGGYVYRVEAMSGCRLGA